MSTLNREDNISIYNESEKKTFSGVANHGYIFTDDIRHTFKEYIDIEGFSYFIILEWKI